MPETSILGGSMKFLGETNVLIWMDCCFRDVEEVPLLPSSGVRRVMVREMTKEGIL
jgi:hypothetical protein